MRFLWELCKHRRSLREKQHGLSSHDIRISDYLDFGLFADLCCVCVCITRVSSKPVFWFMSVRVDSCLWAFDTEHSNAVFLASRHTHKNREHLTASRLIGIKMKPLRCGSEQVCALCFTVNHSTVFFYTQAVLCFLCLRCCSMLTHLWIYGSGLHIQYNVHLGTQHVSTIPKLILRIGLKRLLTWN